MPGAHALLSASAAERWIACPPSARLSEGYEDTGSIDARTGTLAHAIAEARLYAILDAPEWAEDELVRFRADPLYTRAMDEYLDVHIDYVLEIIRKAGSSAEVMLEMRLDYSPWVPEAFGTGDAIIVSEGQLDIIDLKYGKGVPVSAEGNPQLRLYALGAYHELDMLYDIREVTTHIVQPRLDSITTETLAIRELLRWAETEVVPAARLAYAGEGEYAAGEHCRWCRAKNECRAYAEDKLALARHEFADPAMLTDGEIAEILGKAEELASWAKSVKAYAQAQALKHDKVWPGWKLVEGRSNRVITNEGAAIQALEAAGYEVKHTCKLRGLGDLEELIGRKKLPELLEGLLVKPAGAPTLVPETDRRPALDRNEQAKIDFQEDS